MDSLVALVLAAAIAREELRFASILEQEEEGSCGLAVAASLLSLYCGVPADEPALGVMLAESSIRPKPLRPPAVAESVPGGRRGAAGVSLADIAFFLGRAGLRSSAFRMDAGQLRAALDAGFAPIVLHYDRPRPHFALLLARGEGAGAEGFFAIADPARGMEALDPGDLAARWSGAVLLVERGALTPEGRGAIEACAEGCRARLGILARGAASRVALRLAVERAFGGVRRGMEGRRVGAGGARR